MLRQSTVCSLIDVAKPNPGSQAKSGSEKRQVWRLHKYARFVPIEHGGGQSSTAATTGGTWKHYGSTAGENDGELSLSILEGGHLLIGVDREILENLMLWNAHKWLRIARKGDSLLFVSLNPGQTNRRFRVRFQGDEEESNEEACERCISLLQSYTDIKELSSEADDQDIPPSRDNSRPNTYQPSSVGKQTVGAATAPSSTMLPSHQAGIATLATPSAGIVRSGTTPTSSNSSMSAGPLRMSTGSLARHLVLPASEEELPLSEAFKRLTTSGTNWPTHQMRTVLHLCLSDSNFPAFVEQVEKELKKVMNND
ncbi:meiotic recombination protein REC114-like [Sycon ciliatum]|uniref:meiotic recombination protein REC114-like n=1 Tax=Sycon ciliatum TaxID=27933 RepID=UPI0031F63066